MLDNGRPASPIRVAVLQSSINFGGAERLVIEELACLKNDARLALELHVVFERGDMFESAAALGIPVYVWDTPHKSFRILTNYIAIARHLRRNRCQLMHSHLMNVFIPIVRLLAGVRVVSTVHSDYRFSFLKRHSLRFSDQVLCCGERVRQTFKAVLPGRKIFTLPNAVAEPPVKSATTTNGLRAQYKLPSDSVLLVSLGRLVPAKGYDILIEAFRRVAIDMPKVALLIGGDGNEMDRLRELVHSSGVGDRIRLPGMISNIHEFLAASDIYVNSSRVEGLPMSLLEAMTHGLPIIATRVGGNHEVVHDGVTGILVPPDDPVQLADALFKMLRDADLRRRVGNAAITLYKQEYTINRHCEVLKNHYFRLARKGVKK
jgi:glycosyltransferase involved in cell wall biosynthesis